VYVTRGQCWPLVVCTVDYLPMRASINFTLSAPAPAAAAAAAVGTTHRLLRRCASAATFLV